MKKFESNGIVTENPFEVNLVKENGHLDSYYLLKGEAREKITLSDLVNEQIDFVKQNCKTKYGNGIEFENIYSNVDFARIGSSGDCTRIASSGNCSQIGSSGDFARISSSGDSVQIGSSGDCTRIASSGDCTRIASSGNCSQIGSSGDFARIGSSGDHSRIELSGCDGVAFACGYLSAIKAKKDTWISLCEYTENCNGKFVPTFALSAQVGNSDYTDCFGNILSEDNFYILKDKKFTPVILYDGMIYIKKKSKMKDGIEIIKCTGMDDSNEIFCVRKGDLSAHGETLKEAISDLFFKEMEGKDAEEIVAKIKETGYVTREDYRLITGACAYGTEHFAKEHGYENVDKVPLQELLSKLDDRYYGAEKFKSLFKE